MPVCLIQIRKAQSSLFGAQSSEEGIAAYAQESDSVRVVNSLENTFDLAKLDDVAWQVVGSSHQEVRF